MIGKECIVILTYLGITLVNCQLGPFSLQAAVDALHRREAELAFRYHNDPQRNDNFQQEENYLNEGEQQEALRYQQLNRLLAQYLEHDDEMNEGSNGFRDDEFGPDDRKRSVFRERDEAPYPSVFREREVDYLTQPDMAEEFLEEIEQERAMNRENNYREALQHLWDKYQQQENEIKQEIETERERNLPSFYVNPVTEKKRTLPILPWLPASRRKRFPVAKRSSPVYKEADAKVSPDNDKVAKDLKVIFGEPTSDKKKRSSGDEAVKPTEHKREATPHKVDETANASAVNHDQMFSGHDHSHTHEQHGFHSEEHDDHSHEHDEHADHDHDDHADHDHDHDHDDDDNSSHDSEDDDFDDRKKRAVESNKRSNPEVFKEDQLIPGDISDNKQKKSIEWSKYFGMNRRKKSDEWGPAKSFSAVKVDDPTKESTRDNEELLDSVDSKLKAIEDMIIDQAVKYTGAHDGIVNSDEIRQLKDHVISRLATAYSIEKMRRGIEKIKQHAEIERHLKLNEIEEAQNEELGKDKRVAIKKEKAEFDNNNLLIEAAADKKPMDHAENSLGNPDDDDNKKKRNSNHNELINDLFGADEELGVFGHNKCPILKAIERRCLGVDILNGDVHQDLLPVCEIHQLCYLCGTSQSSCDYQYLAEADAICNHNPECQTAARSALMILRGSPNPQLGPRECAKNSCLYRALKNIGL